MAWNFPDNYFVAFWHIDCVICGAKICSFDKLAVEMWHNKQHLEFLSAEKRRFCPICEEIVGASHFCMAHVATKDFIDVMLELK